MLLCRIISCLIEISLECNFKFVAVENFADLSQIHFSLFRIVNKTELFKCYNKLFFSWAHMQKNEAALKLLKPVE